MIFHSYTFFLFFALVLGIYWSLKNFRHQNYLLFFSNCIFYGWWDYRYLALILLSTFIDYFCGLNIKRKPKLIYLSVFLNLGILGLFKYFNFFSHSFSLLLTKLGISSSPLLLEVLLPVGISYYTFQSMAYTIDIHRKEIEPEKNFVDFFVFISFFPQLVAGPIERASKLLVQIKSPRPFSIELFQKGIFLILLGLFKKLVIADRSAFFALTILKDPEAFYSGYTQLIGILFFWIYIYCDFSGYCLIARGASNMLGFKLSINFINPLFAKDVSNFFQRWQITLTKWITDYLFYTLCMRTGLVAFSLFISVLLMGLWHGASMGWVIWGIGIFVFIGIKKIVSSTYETKLKKRLPLPKFIMSFASFSLMILFFLFAATNQVQHLSDLSIVYGKILSIFNEPLKLQLHWLIQNDFYYFKPLVSTPITQIVLAFFFAFLVIIFSYFQKERAIDEYIFKMGQMKQNLIAVFIFLSLLFLQFPTKTTDYFYFQF